MQQNDFPLVYSSFPGLGMNTTFELQKADMYPAYTEEV